MLRCDVAIPLLWPLNLKVAKDRKGRAPNKPLLVLAILDLVEAGLVGPEGLVHKDAELGVRYRECVAVVHGHLCQGRVDPLTLMGSAVDVMKLRSSLGLFVKASGKDENFHEFRTQARAILPLLPTR